MSVSPAAQGTALLLALAAGACLGLYYDLLRPLRLAARRGALTALLDLAFWAAVWPDL